jgi:signal transduction histidine kinase
VIIGVPLAVLSVVIATVSLPTGRATVLVVAVLVAHLAIWRRQIAPVITLGVVCAAFAVQAAASGLFLVLPSAMLFPIAVYSCCAHGRRPAPALALAASVAGGIAAGLRFTHDGSVTAPGLAPNPVLVCGLLVAVGVAAWCLGLFRRTQLAYVTVIEERARDVAAERDEQARRAVLDERARIAREMHDVIAHSLAVILSQAKGGQFVARSDPDRAVEVLATIESAGRAALTDMRTLLGVLRDPGECDPGRHAPQPSLGELQDLIERVRDAGLAVRQTEVGEPCQLTPGGELAVYRTVQEALTNTLRHAGPGSHVDVELAWGSSEMVVTIRSQGGPADGQDRSAGSGHGLAGMRERLAAVGGALTAGSLENGVFRVAAQLPYPARGAAI